MKMRPILFFILLFVGANCSDLSEVVKNQIRETYQFTQFNYNFLKRLQTSVDSIQKNVLQINKQVMADDWSNVGLSTPYFLSKHNRTVKCNMKTDGGRWLVIQKRRKLINQVDFTRDWDSYKEGFGDLDTEFWIGNECLHQITNQKSYELYIAMEDFEKGHFYATYSEFRVENEESGYQLHVGGYEGNVKESLSAHNNMKFTTFDRDNDNTLGNCANHRSGGFWFNNCAKVHLNGLYPTVPDRNNIKLIRWHHYGEILILTSVEMKIRPKQ